MSENLEGKKVEPIDVEKKDKKKLIVGVIVVAVIAIVAFYFGYWVKTPRYSLGLIKEAVATHDLVKFEKHVDIQNLSSRAVDDLVASSMSEEDINNPFVMGMVTLVKNVAVPAVSAVMREVTRSEMMIFSFVPFIRLMDFL